MAGTVFILGRNPILSLAELDCVLRQKNAVGPVQPLANESALVLSGAAGIDPVELIKSLGGTVKIGRLVGVFESLGTLRSAVRSSTWISDVLRPDRHRVEFGVSVYGLPGRERLADELGGWLKRSLEELNHSARLIKSKDGELSSVVVAKNGLIAKGFDLLAVSIQRQIFLAVTAAVQPFRSLGARDYGRPERDARSGMLPPKLALMMVNLAQAKSDAQLIDPFCGSGTVLQEAWLRGYRNIEGSDTSEKAVADSAKNLAWLNAGVRVVLRDARQLAKSLKPNSLDAIVTEPDLGPPFEARTDRELESRMRHASDLYRSFLRAAATVLKPDGRIVMVWPVFRYKNQAQALTTRAVVPQELHVVWPFSSWVPRTARQTLPYERPGQRVGREIVILEKRRTADHAERSRPYNQSRPEPVRRTR